MDVTTLALAKNYTNKKIADIPTLGRYLALWDCVTGLPVTNPGTLPYTYTSGDYYRISNVGTGSYTHTITLAGSTSDEGLYSGTYSISFVISNQVATQYSTISAIAEALGETGVTATGTMITSSTTYDIIKVIEWTDSGSNKVVAMLDDTLQKIGLTQTTATTLTDTVSGGLVSYKPVGTSYTGTASTTVETDSNVGVGDVYFFDGTSWSLQINHLPGIVTDVKVNGSSVVASSVASFVVQTPIKTVSISLPTASWTGSASPYTQVITISGSTANSKIDLQPDSSIIAQLLSDKCAALYIENNDNVLTAYAIKSKPTVNLTVQATVTEVTA